MNYNKLGTLYDNNDFLKPIKANEVKCSICREHHTIELKIIEMPENHKSKKTIPVYMYYYVLTCQQPQKAIVCPRGAHTDYKWLFFRSENFVLLSTLKNMFKRNTTRNL